MEDDPGRQPMPTPEPQHRPLPQGYRQGIITAITVLLGFSLAFFRFWALKPRASGRRDRSSRLAPWSLLSCSRSSRWFAPFGLKMTIRKSIERPSCGSRLLRSYY